MTAAMGGTERDEERGCVRCSSLSGPRERHRRGHPVWMGCLLCHKGDGDCDRVQSERTAAWCGASVDSSAGIGRCRRVVASPVRRCISDARFQHSRATVARRYCAQAVQVCAAAAAHLRRRSGLVAVYVLHAPGCAIRASGSEAKILSDVL